MLFVSLLLTRDLRCKADCSGLTISTRCAGTHSDGVRSAGEKAGKQMLGLIDGLKHRTLSLFMTEVWITRAHSIVGHLVSMITEFQRHMEAMHIRLHKANLRPDKASETPVLPVPKTSSVINLFVLLLYMR